MITPENVRAIPLLAQLPDETQLLICERAADVRVQAGEWLIHEGEIPAFFVLLEGCVDVVKSLADHEQVINRYKPGEYFGELPLLLGSSAVASIRASEPTRALRLEAADFHTLVLGNAKVNDQLLRTMLQRVSQLQQLTVETPVTRVQIIGHRWDENCFGLRDFLARNQIAFNWLDVDDSIDRPAIPDEIIAGGTFPLVVLPDGSRLSAPSARQLADALHLQTTPSDSVYDVAIVGGGPAGLAAAVYGASEGLHTIMIEREAPGGQAGTSSRIENYLGFPAGLSGSELSRRAWQQARRFGTEILVAREVLGIKPGTDRHRVLLDADESVQCRAVVIATGVMWRRLIAPGIDQMVGRGVYYGASRTEAFATRGKDIYLIGGGNSAGQAALFFANYARSVTLLVRGDSLARSMSQYLIDQLQTKTNVFVRPHSQVIAVEGGEHLEAIVVHDEAARQDETLETDELFVLIGADAQTDWLPSQIARDEHGYILTGRDVPEGPEGERPGFVDRDPYLLETSVPGIFAAGDVRHDSIKRVASGVGEGSMSIAFIHQYLGQIPEAPSPQPLEAVRR